MFKLLKLVNFPTKNSDLHILRHTCGNWYLSDLTECAKLTYVNYSIIP